MLAAVFLFSVNLREPLYKYIIMAFPCIFVTFFVFFWKGNPFLGTKIQTETWYTFHRFSTLIVSISALLYLCINVHLQQAATNKENEEFIYQLKFLSNHDTLTGLPNRRMILERVKTLKKYSVAIFDVDDFKKINDSYGHEIGDKVLCGIVNCILKELQSETLFGRWGGEEFLIIFPDVERKEIKTLMNSVVKAVENEKFVFDGINVNVTVTAGVADTTSADNFDEVVAFADSLMYRGKLAGKNQVVFSKKSFLL